MPSTDLPPKPFLRYFYKEKNVDSDSESEVPLIVEEDRVHLWTQHLQRRRFLLIHAGVLCFYIALTAAILQWVVRSKCHCSCNGLIYTPAREAVRYERVAMNTALHEQNRFKGQPREELDDAWNGILQYINLRVGEDVLIKINRTSVPFNDEKGGYLVTLDVFHELHCLNVIRQQLYREYYPDKRSKVKQFVHVDHCIDILRQVLMCHSDLALQTFDWIDDYRWPFPNFHIDHECRNWDAIMEWAEKYHVPDLRGPIVAYPTLGVSWREDDD